MMLDVMRTQEDPLQRQRLLVEEERLKYLNQEELLIQQLQWVQGTTDSCNNLSLYRDNSNPYTQKLDMVIYTVDSQHWSIWEHEAFVRCKKVFVEI